MYNLSYSKAKRKSEMKKDFKLMVGFYVKDAKTGRFKPSCIAEQYITTEEHNMLNDLTVRYIGAELASGVYDTHLGD